MRNPKVISSEPITSKRKVTILQYHYHNTMSFDLYTFPLVCTGKVLGTIQSSNVSRGHKTAAYMCESTSDKLEKDLRRVLAKDVEKKSSSCVSDESRSKRSKKGPTVDTSEFKPPPQRDEISKQCRDSVSPSG